MNRSEAIKQYVEKFGGFPYFLVMGASDKALIELVKKSLESGEEIKPVEGRIY